MTNSILIFNIYRVAKGECLVTPLGPFSSFEFGEWVDQSCKIFLPGGPVLVVMEDLIAELVDKLVKAEIHLRFHLVIQELLLEVV